MRRMRDWKGGDEVLFIPLRLVYLMIPLADDDDVNIGKSYY